MIGHTLPGSFLLMMGLWWTISQFRRFHLSRVASGSPYYNSPTFRFFFLPRCLANYEFEGAFKIFLTVVMFVGELIRPGHPLPYSIENASHLTMHVVVFINGLTDILKHHKVPLPKSVNYVSQALAMSTVGMIFLFHVHGREAIYTSLHLLIAFCALMTALGMVIEMNFPTSVTAGLWRSYFTLLQGTWFWQTGFIVDNPFPGDHTWDPDNKHHMMLLHLIFAWHMMAIFIVQIMIGSIVACFYRHHSPTLAEDEYRLLKDPSLQNDKAQEAAIILPTEDANRDFE